MGRKRASPEKRFAEAANELGLWQAQRFLDFMIQTVNDLHKTPGQTLPETKKKEQK